MLSLRSEVYAGSGYITRHPGNPYPNDTQPPPPYTSRSPPAAGNSCAGNSEDDGNSEMVLHQLKTGEEVAPWWPPYMILQTPLSTLTTVATTANHCFRLKLMGFMHKNNPMCSYKP